MTFNYYYGSQAEQFNFIKIPKTLVVDPMFEGLSVNAKLLYGVLLDRMNLSMKNKWFDAENRVYIIYQVSEIMADFNFSKKTAVKYLNELEEFGLVEKKRRGLGLPSLLYVKNFIVQKDYSNPDEEMDMNDSEYIQDNQGTSRGVGTVTSRGVQEETSRGVEMVTSRSVHMETSRGVETGTSRSIDLGTFRGVEMEPQEVEVWEPLINKTNNSNTNINNTKTNNTDINNILSNRIAGGKFESAIEDVMRCDESMSEFDSYMAFIKKSIEFDILIERYPYDVSLIEGIVNLIVETIVSNNDYIVISSNRFPKAVVKSRFSKLTMTHIEYVLECMNKNTTDVKNIKKYLLAALYNAPVTIDSYYKARVNHDMPELAGM